MKIVFLYTVSQDGFDYLRENLPEDIEIIARIREEGSSLITPNKDPEIVAACKEASILMGPYVTEEILSLALPENGGKLKLVFIPWAGVDRVNFDLINKYQVPVANSHGNARTVAEHAITLMLAASKNIIHHDTLLRKGDWSSRFRNPDRASIIVAGSTVGLLGFGAIGTECAKLLQGFSVKITACRKNPKNSSSEQKELVQKIYSTSELNTFLQDADIVINSLPLTEETLGLLGAEQFQAMKNGSILINVGRGKTIDEKALFDALEQGKLFAAGLDPQWCYPPRGSEKDKAGPTYPSNYPIHDFDNVVLSPHRAGDTGSYERSHWADVIENILRVYNRLEPQNLIDTKRGY